MVKAETLEELLVMHDKAFGRAEKETLEVTVISTGQYKVTSNHSEYLVTCGRTPDNWLFVACLCQGALNGRACKHGAVALAKHIFIKQREIEKRNREKETYLPNTSDKKPDKLGGVRY